MPTRQSALVSVLHPGPPPPTSNLPPERLAELRTIHCVLLAGGAAGLALAGVLGMGSSTLGGQMGVP